MASSFSVSSQGSQKYDVFLNFRGEDVRFKLLGYLIFALNQASLNIFVDYKLKRGQHIKSALMDAIQDSKVSLTIFSEGYASSAWCLDELVEIMECRENPMLRQKVIPVFYHVTASDVRNQSGVFAEEFAKHESDYGSRSKVPLWRAAMAAAGCLSGRSMKKTSPEVDVMMQIVNDVLEILSRKPLEISSGKLEDRSNIQQQQGNGSIWIISTRQGIHVEDLNTVLMSIEVQVGGKPSESHSSQRSETSSSHRSPPMSYRSRTTLRTPMAATATPTKSTLNNSSLVSGGGNYRNGVNSYGLGSTMIPTNSRTQVGLPMSSSDQQLPSSDQHLCRSREHKSRERKSRSRECRLRERGSRERDLHRSRSREHDLHSLDLYLHSLELDLCSLDLGKLCSPHLRKSRECDLHKSRERRLKSRERRSREHKSRERRSKSRERDLHKSRERRSKSRERRSRERRSREHKSRSRERRSRECRRRSGRSESRRSCRRAQQSRRSESVKRGQQSRKSKSDKRRQQSCRSDQARRGRQSRRSGKAR